MISDSPYDFTKHPLGWTAGMACGGIGSILMLIPVAFSNGEPLAAAAAFLRQNGQVILPSTARPELLLMSGLVLQVMIGVLLGVLYAVSQQSIPAPGFASVGAFYGIVIWLIGRQVVSGLTGDGHEALRSWPWLLACLVYGFTLSGAAAWQQARRHAGSVSTAPLD